MRRCQYQYIYSLKGYLKMDHKDQVKGKNRDYLMKFAQAFNKALNYRVGSVGDLLPGTAT